MRSMIRPALVVLVAAALGFGAARPAEAQQQRNNVISANPFGLLIELFNAEYERVVSESSTAGIGGSMYNREDQDYINADVFFRFYPQGTPPEGWAFGVKAGLTNVPDSGTYFGFGFDANRSWLLGVNNNFYVGVGFGLKRLLGVSDDESFDVRFVPTIRLVNVGIAF
jgi:hypothetical protein